VTAAQLREAAEQAAEDCGPALAAVFHHEAALALEDEHRAHVAEDLTQTSVQPSYRPIAALLIVAARETWPALARRWDTPPW
jgi:hypothetical protein